MAFKPASITELSGQISAGGGIAQPNLFYVELPGGISDVSTKEMGLLCKEVELPSRQITTVDRLHWGAQRKVAYGHLTDSISMRFLVLNNASVRRYFETWQNLIVPGADGSRNYDEQQVVGFYNDYAKTIKIHQLKKNFELSLYSKKFDLPLPNFVKNSLRNIGGLNFSNNLFALNIGVDGINAGFSIDGNASYVCTLYEAYPSMINAEQLSDDQGNTLEMYSVQFTFRNWSGAALDDNNPISRIRNEIERGIGQLRDKVEDTIKSKARKLLDKI